MFAPGDEVVCVDDAGIPVGIPSRPVRGAHYTVREMYFHGVFLVELINPKAMSLFCQTTQQVVLGEPGFSASRFRLVRRESIEIFRAMCVSTKPLVEV